MIAPPDIKSIMDNQFKNVKTQARLLSKALWYEWRMKLLKGLKPGFLEIEEGMNEDDNSLNQQESIIESILPAMIEQNDALVAESQTLQAHADALASCDQEEYKEARQRLGQVEQEVMSNQRMVLELEHQLRANAKEIADAVECKEEYVAQTKEAERVRQESRGWKTFEVAALQGESLIPVPLQYASDLGADNVIALEEAYGWKIVSATGQSLTMTYKDSLQLYFTPASFISPGSSSPAQPEESPISLTYIGDGHEYHPRPLTTEKRFFLQIVRAQLQCLQQSSTDTSDLLNFIGRNWEAALTVAEEVRSLSIGYITEATILSDEVMAVQAVLLMRGMRTKVEVSFQVQAQGGEGVAGLDIAVKSGVRVVYGEGLKEKKMADFLDQRLSEGGDAEEKGTWAKAVSRLEERLRERGKK